MEKELRAILQKILDDATLGLDDTNKRVWPIRAANYRAAKELLKRVA